MFGDLKRLLLWKVVKHPTTIIYLFQNSQEDLHYLDTVLFDALWRTWTEPHRLLSSAVMTLQESDLSDWTQDSSVLVHFIIPHWTNSGPLHYPPNRTDGLTLYSRLCQHPVLLKYENFSGRIEMSSFKLCSKGKLAVSDVEEKNLKATGKIDLFSYCYLFSDSWKDVNALKNKEKLRSCQIVSYTPNWYEIYSINQSILMVPVQNKIIFKDYIKK